jgi:hypothetical protein
VLVERKRRGQNQGGSMMQKAMELKRKRNLEPVKGNRFAALQLPELNQISKDIDIKIGHDKSDSMNILNDMIESEARRCEQFARDNPKIMLAVNLDVCNINESDEGLVQDVGFENINDLEPVNENLDVCNINQTGNGAVQGYLASPQCFLKEPSSSELWTEVVRRGKPSGKARGRRVKVVENETGLLKY